MREVAPSCIFLQTDDKGCLSNHDRDALFHMLRQESENRMCFDCAARNATWISATFSIFLCLTCSGQHRGLGAKISFVRSIDLDLVRLEEALRLQIGGNARARTFFRNHGILDGKQIDYRSKAAERYRKLLDKEVAALLHEYRPDFSWTRSSPCEAPLAVEGAPKLEWNQRKQKEDSEESAYAYGYKAAEVETSVKEPQYMPLTERLTCDSVAKVVQKPKTDDFDFDFESAFECGALASINKQTVGQTVGRSKARPSNDTKEAAQSAPRRDLQNAKAISSDDFRDSQDRSAPSDLARFKNAQGISSDAYFGKDTSQQREGWVDDEMGARLSIIREGAIQKAGEIASAAHDGLKSAACWFNKMSSTPSYL